MYMYLNLYMHKLYYINKIDVKISNKDYLHP